MSVPAPVSPGGTLGIVGGGQLGRMIALAAAALGYRSHVYSPEPDGPAAQVAAAATVGAYDDAAALADFAAAVDAVTYEFENVPAATAALLEARRPVRPGAHALAVAQDRLSEKAFFTGLGAQTAPYRAVADRPELDRAVAALGLPAVLKTRRLGYDGKGQALLRAPADLAAGLAAMAGRPAILEGFVDFRLEVSVVAARGAGGDIAIYDLVENRHRHHILDVTLVPAAVDGTLAAAAQAVARRVLLALDYVGVLAIEFFVTRDHRLLVNEMAPRVHNSGHWTIEGAETSQFEQAARAALGLPLGAVTRRGDAVMMNLIGEEAAAWPALLAAPGAHLHLYGKREAKPGRKMGHVTRLLPVGAALDPVAGALRRLAGG